MKRRHINDGEKINGFYISDIMRGFIGENKEGQKMLKIMGLPTNVIPFSIVALIRNGRACWYDSNNQLATISFTMKPTQLECSGTYLGKSKTIKMFREWSEHENADVIAHLESEGIGNLCMKCIYKKLDE